MVGKHRGRQQELKEGEEEVASSMVHHLERLSLVDFADLRGVARLGDAVKLAGAVVDADTSGFIEIVHSNVWASYITTSGRSPFDRNIGKYSKHCQRHY